MSKSERRLKWVEINGCLVAEHVACNWIDMEYPRRRRSDKKLKVLKVKEVDELLDLTKLPPERRMEVKNKLVERGLMELGAVELSSWYDTISWLDRR